MNRVLITSLCFEYRMDVLFRAYVLDTNDLSGWLLFLDIPVNIPKANFKSLFEFRDSIKKIGQQMPVNVVRVGGKLYPTMGNKRTSSLIALGRDTIKVNEVSVKTSPKWNMDRTLCSCYFEGLAKEIKDKFTTWIKEHSYLDIGNQRKVLNAW